MVVGDEATSVLNPGWPPSAVPLAFSLLFSVPRVHFRRPVRNVRSRRSGRSGNWPISPAPSSAGAKGRNEGTLFLLSFFFFFLYIDTAAVPLEIDPDWDAFAAELWFAFIEPPPRGRNGIHQHFRYWLNTHRQSLFHSLWIGSRNLSFYLISWEYRYKNSVVHVNILIGLIY